MRASAAPWLAVLFVLLGLPFLSLTSFHVDAANELSCLYPCGWAEFSVKIFGTDVPLMLMTYVGTIKALLFQPILRVFPATPFALRLPFLILGACSVWLFCALLEKVSGIRAAIAGTLLLVTDASFLLATSYDFGPVVFLHLFLLGGMWLLLRFHETEKPVYLALAFLLFGLGLWQKFLFAWMLSGVMIAGVVVFPKRVFAVLNLRRVAIATLALCIGAGPVIYYNIVRPFATFNVKAIAAEDPTLKEKINGFERVMQGDSWFAFINDETDPPVPLIVPNASRLPVALDGLLKGIRPEWMLSAFLLSCALVPWLWFTKSRQPALFSFVAMAVIWLMMAATPKAGTTIHHVILMWPFPHLLMTLAGFEIAKRFDRRAAFVVVACAALLIAGNCILLNRYYARLVTKGPGIVWTDATQTLFAELQSMGAAHVVASDWGYAPTLCLLSKGKMAVDDISFQLLSTSDENKEMVLGLLDDSNAVFVAHRAEGEQFVGVQAILDKRARESGHAKKLLKVITDSGGRPRFEIARYEKGGPSVSQEPDLAPTVVTANPAHAQHLSGFHEIEHNAWRWTEPRFSVRLGRPAPGPLSLAVDLYVPDVSIQKLGPIALNAYVADSLIGTKVYSSAGAHRFDAAIPKGTNSPIEVRFTLDKHIPATDNDKRNLGVIVKSVRVFPAAASK